MKSVSTSEFIAIVRESVRKVGEGSESASIRGQFFSIQYLVSSVLKNGYYAKNQENKDDKNPYWGRNIYAIKSYIPQLGIDYATQAIKDGKVLTEKTEEENPFESIISNLIFRHKESGRYYIQVMKNAYESRLFLDGQPMSDEDKAILDRYKKPYKAQEGLSSEYKKLALDKVLKVTIDGVTYTISNEPNVTTINVTSESTSETTSESK